MGIDLTETGPGQQEAFKANCANSGDPAAATGKIVHIVAVASGMRGVGKSTIVGLLAAALCRDGLAVGLLDADIENTHIPRMFGITPPPLANGAEESVPVKSRGGIRLMSLKRMLPGSGQPIPSAGSVISDGIQRLRQALVCAHLDYLIVNLPPGTSDTGLAVAQALPLDGVVLITSPRDTAEMALRETATAVKHLGVPVIGLVDNMRHVVCPACGSDIYVFGAGQAEFSAQLIKTEMLGRMPLDPELACLCDAGAIEDYRSPALDTIIANVRRSVGMHQGRRSGPTPAPT